MLGATLAILLFCTQAAVAATFKLNIQIATNQVIAQKALGYNLCIAKKVNDDYTVVWTGNTDYFFNNEFEWLEAYEVFGTKNFTNGAHVSSTTNEVVIAPGQTSNLTANGVMQSATGPVFPTGPFFVDNKFGIIHIGVNGLFGNTFLPIYVSPAVAASFNTFQPIPTVKVWWALKQTTSTMIFGSETPGFEVVYNGVTNQIISYAGPDGNGLWSAGPLGSNSSDPTSTLPFSSASVGSSQTSTGKAPPSTFSTSVISTGKAATQTKGLAIEGRYERRYPVVKSTPA